MKQESQAERRARQFELDWEQVHDEIREKHTALGNAAGAARFDAILTGYMGMEERTDAVNPMVAALQVATEDLIEVMSDVGFDRERLATAHVMMTMKEDISAEMRSFDDGSALIVMSDSILSLCAFYCRCVAVALSRMREGGPLKRLATTYRTVTRGDLGMDISTISGMLRYYHVSQRVHGVAGLLAFEVSDEAEDITAALSVQAMRFVAGHELVHHAFGHGARSSGWDQHQEYQADVGAHMALVRLAEKGARKGIPAEVMALWGALAAVLAVHSAEKALFVRCGASHPPALDRVRMLLAQVGPRVRGPAEVFLRPLLAATDAATVFAEGAETFDSERVLASPMISSPLSASYLRTIEILDTAMCRSLEQLLAGMGQLHADEACLIEGARLAHSGRAAEALHRWGVRNDVVQRLVDLERPLTFHSLVSCLEAAFSRLCLPESTVSVVSASLLVPALRQIAAR